VQHLRQLHRPAYVRVIAALCPSAATAVISTSGYVAAILDIDVSRHRR